ncbi:hypothetical protein [uncultured Sphingomonas sp.]|uniref:hypothetical protein n=1 Tax=uncultured Sphingomonas sp. TaxID=158754 RepID=UPI0025DB24E4|nr:hypothetical protein [uncultured Sphingomonas sp.]
MLTPQWGERRVAIRQRSRRLWIAGIAGLLIASPFLLSAAARHYAASGGAMQDGRFPMWIPITYWAIVVAVALIGTGRLYRTSDEFERRRLIDGFAVGGMVLGLANPPAFFLGYQFGIMAVWTIAFLAGLAVFARPRVAA